MKKAVIISAFSLTLLIPVGLSESSISNVFNAQYWSEVIELKTEIQSLNRKSWEQKAELYRRLVVASLKVAELKKKEKDRKRLYAEAWEAQHIGYRYWLKANGRYDDIFYYYRNLVPRLT